MIVDMSYCLKNDLSLYQYLLKQFRLHHLMFISHNLTAQIKILNLFSIGTQAPHRERRKIIPDTMKVSQKAIQRMMVVTPKENMLQIIPIMAITCKRHIQFVEYFLNEGYFATNNHFQLLHVTNRFTYHFAANNHTFVSSKVTKI